MKIRTNRKSDAYRRISCAGFTLGEPRYYTSVEQMHFMKRVECDFTCVCGKRETFVHGLMDKRDIEYNALFHKDGIDYVWDIALQLERSGSVSEKHLRSDGYSEDDIRRIRYVYDLEDELKKLRPLKKLAQINSPDLYRAVYENHV